MNSSHRIALKVSAILWTVWGLVHVLAGVMTISQPTSKAIAGIADAVDPATLEMAYPMAMGAALNQHGFNLLWIGVTTIVGAIFIWRGRAAAIFLAALVGGLADVGYFLFLDLGGFVNFVPGTIMTIVSASAIALSFWVWFSALRHEAAPSAAGQVAS